MEVVLQLTGGNSRKFTPLNCQGVNVCTSAWIIYGTCTKTDLLYYALFSLKWSTIDIF